jgi:hypothetical protein
MDAQSARLRCIALETRIYAQWQANRRGDYLDALANVYCPPNAKRWAQMVRKIYAKNSQTICLK